MKLEFYSEKKLKKEILRIVGKYLDLNDYKVFFFGSRVRGNRLSHADIDIGIDGEKEIPVEIKLKIEEEIDKIPTLYKFDIIDFSKVCESFRRQALKDIEYVK